MSHAWYACHLCGGDPPLLFRARPKARGKRKGHVHCPICDRRAEIADAPLLDEPAPAPPATPVAASASSPAPVQRCPIRDNAERAAREMADKQVATVLRGVLWNVENFTQGRRPNYRGLGATRLQVIHRTLLKHPLGSVPAEFTVLLEAGADATQPLPYPIELPPTLAEQAAENAARALQIAQSFDSPAPAPPAAAPPAAAPPAAAPPPPAAPNPSATDFLLHATGGFGGVSATTGRSTDTDYSAEAYAFLVNHPLCAGPPVVRPFNWDGSDIDKFPRVRGYALFDFVHFVIGVVHAPSPGHAPELRSAVLFDMLRDIVGQADRRPVLFGGDLNFKAEEIADCAAPCFAHFGFENLAIKGAGDVSLPQPSYRDTSLRMGLSDPYKARYQSQPYDQLWIRQGIGDDRATVRAREGWVMEDVIALQLPDLARRLSEARILSLAARARALLTPPVRSMSSRHVVIPDDEDVRDAQRDSEALVEEVMGFARELRDSAPRSGGDARARIEACDPIEILGQSVHVMQQFSTFAREVRDVLRTQGPAPDPAASGLSDPDKIAKDADEEIALSIQRRTDARKFGNPTSSGQMTSTCSWARDMSDACYRLYYALRYEPVEIDMYREFVSDHSPIAFAVEVTPPNG